MDHVEADDHVGVFGSLEIHVNLLLAMFLSEAFEAASDDFHGEEGEQLPNLRLYALEDCEFPL